MDFLTAKGRTFFFPEDMSKFGAVDDMYLHLGNYAQGRITMFTDTDGKACTFQVYLKPCGLYASRCHVYLMSSSTGPGAERSQIGTSHNEVCKKLANLSPNEETVQMREVFMSVGKTQLSGDFGNLMATTTPNKSGEVEENLEAPPFVLRDHVMKGPFTDQTVSDNKLNIDYKSVTESSYSE